MARGIVELGGAATGRALLAVFRRVYVINLPYRTDRRREMTAELARIGLGPGTPEVTWFDAIRPADPGGFPTIGTRGCFESHLAVLRLIAEGPDEAGLLLEDDADFCAGLGRELARLQGAEWDMFFGVYTGEDREPPRLESGVILCRPEDGLWTTHFLGVTRDTARRLVPYLEGIARRPPGDPEGGPMHVDGAYAWFRRENPDIRTLCPDQPMARQRPSRTDILTSRSAERHVWMRPFFDALRRLKRARGLHRS